MSAKQRMGVVLIACSIAGAGLLFLLGQGSLGTDALQAWLSQLSGRAFTPWILFVSVFLGGIIVFPVAPAIIFTGAVYGLQGFPIALAGLFSACLTGYLIGKRLGAEWAHKTPKAKRMSELIARHGALTSAVARWIPGVPFALQNMLLGAAEVRLPQYLMGSLVGASGISFIFLSTGAAGAEILVRIQGALLYGWFAPGIGLAVGAWLFIRKSPAQVSTSQPDEVPLP